jgi:SHAQKYF class myb-like DNA-binding protein
MVINNASIQIMNGQLPVTITHFSESERENERDTVHQSSSASVVSWNDNEQALEQGIPDEIHDDSITKISDSPIEVSDSTKLSNSLLNSLTGSGITIEPSWNDIVLTESPLILAAAASACPNSKLRRRRRSIEETNPKLKQAGRWTDAEHELFLFGLTVYGREWKKVARHIPTRSSTQVRSHAQKYFTKLELLNQLQQPEQEKELMQPILNIQQTECQILDIQNTVENENSSQPPKIHIDLSDCVTRLSSCPVVHSDNSNNTDCPDDDQNTVASALLCLKQQSGMICNILDATPISSYISSHSTNISSSKSLIQSITSDMSDQTILNLSSTESSSACSPSIKVVPSQEVSQITKLSDECSEDGMCRKRKRSPDNSDATSCNTESMECATRLRHSNEDSVLITTQSSDPIEQDVNETLLRLFERLFHLREQYSQRLKNIKIIHHQ